MAKIEMDISEYEEMKKNARLLEESLAREKKQSEKIEELNKEKIAILEDNVHQVTIIEETTTHQVTYSKRPLKELLQRVWDLITNYGNYPTYNKVHVDSLEWQVGNLMDNFFEIKTFTNPPVRTVTRKGFDEVKSEIRKEYFENLKKSTKDALEELKNLRTEYEDLKKSKVALEKAYGELDNNFKKTVNRVPVLEKEIEELKIQNETIEIQKGWFYGFWKGTPKQES